MVRSIMFYRAFLSLVCVAQLTVSLSLSSRAAGVLTLTISLAPLTLAAAENDETGTTATDDDDAKECSEPGTCDNSENVDLDTNTDASSESETNSEQTNESSLSTPSATTGPNGDRLITHEELALHTGGEAGIWLSILGKVYDVTTGKSFYDAEKGSYKFYAGRDASPCFSSGKNTIEGAEEKWEEWEDKRLMSVWEWSTFYEDHETYEYLGFLAGGRYFDELGNELPLRQDIIGRSSGAKEVADAERERKKKERMAAREAKKKKKLLHS